MKQRLSPILFQHLEEVRSHHFGDVAWHCMVVPYHSLNMPQLCVSANRSLYQPNEHADYCYSQTAQCKEYQEWSKVLFPKAHFKALPEWSGGSLGSWGRIR